MADQKPQDSERETLAPAAAPPVDPADVEGVESTEGGLSQFGHFVKNYWSHILLVILIPIVLYRGVKYFNEKDAVARESAYVDLESAQFGKKPSATRFIDLADLHNDVSGYQARSLLLAADLLLADGLGASTDGAQLTVNDREERLGKAEKLYARVTNLTDRTTLQEIKARFGLASILETRGARGDQKAFEAAGKAYDDIEKLAGDQWPLQAAEAKTRRDDLDKLKESLPFPKKRQAVTLEDLKPKTPSPTPAPPILP